MARWRSSRVRAVLLRPVVGQQQGRGLLSAPAGGGEHLAKPRTGVVKFMVAHRHSVISHGAHGAQLRRLCGIQRLDQGAHREVPAVHSQRPRMGGPLLLQCGGQPGITSRRPSGPVLPGQKAGVQVMGKQNGGGARLSFRRPRSGQQNTAQQRRRGYQPDPASQPIHHAPSPFYLDLTAPILPQNPAFRKRDFTLPFRSLSVCIQYSVKVSNIIFLKISTVFPMIFSGRAERRICHTIFRVSSKFPGK